MDQESVQKLRCRMEFAETIPSGVSGFPYPPISIWRCANGCGREAANNNPDNLITVPKFCTATIEDASLIYDAHKKGRAGCVSDWQPFRVEFCRCPSGMVNRSKERAMITASDDWKYGRSHSTVHLPGGGYESLY